MTNLSGRWGAMCSEIPVPASQTPARSRDEAADCTLPATVLQLLGLDVKVAAADEQHCLGSQPLASRAEQLPVFQCETCSCLQINRQGQCPAWNRAIVKESKIAPTAHLDASLPRHSARRSPCQQARSNCEWTNMQKSHEKTHEPSCNSTCHAPNHSHNAHLTQF